MADDEKAGPGNEEEDDERTELRRRVAELQAELSRRPRGLTKTERWAGWIVGTLLGAASLATIVVLLGGGLPRPCDCPDDRADPADGSGEQRQQAALERLLREHTTDFQECFDVWAREHSSEVRPGWAVIVRLEVLAGVGGRVQEARATGDNLPEALGGCLERRVRTWTFPEPGPYTLELPFAVEGSPLPIGVGDAGRPARGETDGDDRGSASE